MCIYIVQSPFQTDQANRHQKASGSTTSVDCKLKEIIIFNRQLVAIFLSSYRGINKVLAMSFSVCKTVSIH